MKAYRDDAEILKLALKDGCYESITRALEKMDGSQSAVITDRRIYIVHAVPGDSGYSCFEAPDPVSLLDLLMKLVPAIGPIQRMTLRPCENAPSQRGRGH